MGFVYGVTTPSELCVLMSGDLFGWTGRRLDFSREGLLSLGLIWTTECLGGRYEAVDYANILPHIARRESTPTVAQSVFRAGSRAERARIWCEYVDGVLQGGTVIVTSTQAVPLTVTPVVAMPVRPGEEVPVGQLPELTEPFDGRFAGNVHNVVCDEYDAGFIGRGRVPEAAAASQRKSSSRTINAMRLKRASPACWWR